MLFTYMVSLLITQAPNNFPVTKVGRRGENKESLSAERSGGGTN